MDPVPDRIETGNRTCNPDPVSYFENLTWGTGSGASNEECESSNRIPGSGTWNQLSGFSPVMIRIEDMYLNILSGSKIVSRYPVLRFTSCHPIRRSGFSIPATRSGGLVSVYKIWIKVPITRHRYPVPLLPGCLNIFADLNRFAKNQK